MRLVSWNVNGIRAVFDRKKPKSLAPPGAPFKGFWDWLEEKDPDVLCLQETKLQEHQIPPELQSDLLEEKMGYRIWWAHAERKGYSGVALLVKKDLPAEVTIGLGEERFDREGRTIVADLDEFILINGYFPQGRRSEERLEYKLDYYDHVLGVIREYREKKNWSVVVTGDLNTAHKEVDLINPKVNSKFSGFMPKEREWLDRYLDSKEGGLVDSFRVFHEEARGQDVYTWWDYKTRGYEKKRGWRIDYFLVDEDLSENMVDAGKYDTGRDASDHCPIFVDLEFEDDDE